MLQKYYEMLDKFNKKLEEKDILISSRSAIAQEVPFGKQVVYVKEADISNRSYKKKEILG